MERGREGERERGREGGREREKQTETEQFIQIRNIDRGEPLTSRVIGSIA